MKKLLLLISFICSVAVCAHAQNNDSQLLKKLVEKNVLTQDEADELAQDQQTETNGSFEQTTRKIREAFSTPYMKFGGYALMMYQYSNTQEVKHKVDPRVVFVSMTGQFNKFRYFILSEFVDPRVYEFYGEWAPSDAIKLKGGLMKVPYALENPISLIDLETVSNTRSVSNLIGMTGDVMQLQNGFNNSGRDLGIMLHGNLFKKNGHELVQYAAGVFQGSGIKKTNGNWFENNNTKDFVSSLYLKPISEFRIGGSVYFGQTNYSTNLTGQEKPHVRNRWLISSDYQSDRFYARAEWIHGNDGGIKKEGLYGTALYYVVPNKLNFAAKVDYMNNNKDTGSEVIDYTAAVNYYFYKACRFQLNYTYSDYSKVWGSKDSHNIAAQMQIVF
ncbi:hypothetical protein M2132_001313 [Dysgonomonas sp. PH5-45]|uniref:porin n=1 Tax=unclassified Dysgonomonas TaxID=2630389 RepID=UPI002476577C|nr:MULTISPECIES: porin [unclassified Dysgonomonas]MDH6354976.1 hypothetical protein [Dysgonomonas sp. PH5-45]MDH6387900.1 hypothetical protein [Dysgonomonas sp. PH5-37]